MENTFIKKPVKGQVMFPPFFKIIGRCLVVTGLVPLAYRKLMETNIHVAEDNGNINYGTSLTQGKPDMFHFVFLLVVIAGLIMIAWSREKVEDEMLRMLRVRSFVIAFLLGLIFVIGYTLAQVLTGVSYWPFFGIELVTGVLLAHTLIFYLQKKFVR